METGHFKLDISRAGQRLWVSYNFESFPPCGSEDRVSNGTSSNKSELLFPVTMQSMQSESKYQLVFVVSFSFQKSCKTFGLYNPLKLPGVFRVQKF